MRKSFPFVGVVVLLIAMLIPTLTGFQCASAEMTSAKLYLQRSDWDNAIKSLEQEVANNPKNAEAWFLLGRTRAQKNDFGRMNEAFDRALEIGPAHAQEIRDIRYGYWATYVNMGVDFFNKARDSVEYYDRAIAAFETAILIIPDSAGTYKNLAFCYLSKNDVPRALPSLEKAFSISPDPLTARYIGEIYYDMGLRHKERFEGSENKMEVRILMTPTEVQSIFGEPTSKSSTKVKKTTKEKWVYAPFNLTLNFEDNQLKSWEESGRKEEKEPKVIYKSTAEKDSAMKYFEKALPVLEQARSLDPQDADLLAILSNVYVAAEKTDIAMETFKSGVEADPKNKVFRYNYGVLLLRASDFEKAAAQFRAALEIDSTYDAALYNLGVTYVNWGVHIRESAEDPSKVEVAYKEKFSEGLPYLERMARLRPHDPEAWELLGKVYANLGRSKDAIVAFETADKIRNQK